MRDKSIKWPSADGMVEPGEQVRDRKHPVDIATVVTVRDAPAKGYNIAGTEKTVADDNSHYPDSDPVIDIVWSALDEEANLTTACEEHSVYHFPLTRLVSESCVRDVPPGELRESPYHSRTFAVTENWNEGYIKKIRGQGYINSLLVAHDTTAGLELLAGHKRQWVAQQANLDTVAVR